MLFRRFGKRDNLAEKKMQLVVFKITPIGVPFLWTDKALSQD